MNNKTGQFYTVLWFTIPNAILLAVATGCGLLIQGLYHDTAGFAAQAIGQDFISLTVTFPALIISAILTGRGSGRARLVWLGILTYIVYTYAIAAFNVRFNQMFLVYVALLGFSIYTLIFGIVYTDLAKIKALFEEKTPVKTVSTFLAVLAMLFYFLWLRELVPSLIKGTVPKSITDSGLPTNAVHVLDMAWMLPVMLMTAVWLRQKQPVGYTLAGILLTFIFIMGLALISMTAFMKRLNQPVEMEIIAFFGMMSTASLFVLIWYLKNCNRSK
jgi:hypothetical protein